MATNYKGSWFVQPTNKQQPIKKAPSYVDPNDKPKAKKKVKQQEQYKRSFDRARNKYYDLT